MKKIKRETESIVFNPPFGDIVRIVINDHRMLTNDEFQKDPVVKTKRAFLQMKRIYPTESILDTCRRSGVKNERVILDWCKKDEDFKRAYQVINGHLNCYLKELYERNRTEKRTT